MNTATANQIDQLLQHSGLFPQDKQSFKNYLNFDFSKETILITGAAGSIGSSLSKQLSACIFKKLILIDIAESPLYDLINAPEFENINNVEFSIINITQEDSLQHLFEIFKPTIIFHTAAYKHVPLMETNPYESIKTNIFGTKLLADLALIYKVKKFIFISTDKAVNPIGVMGLSKRISEDYLSFLSKSSSTLFLITRFGNVFGSNGSAVALFKHRIENEKTVIITNKDISRYFIDMQKACNLILKIASDYNEQSELFTFNMGNSIKITDLVERLILFCNETQVDIKFSKLRPGEKLHEELVSENEILIPTIHNDILLVKKKNNFNFPISYLESLSKITAFTSHKDIKAILKSYL
ncbi:polysaccharide biosynthesis protein [Algibacter sp. L1A34]|uniref:polysaccharide biosynthesis protein n=1 Tax=Algibacter sp. L1A34 TaxID=2686365 RepID=UPI00131B9586|nr:polysaccharide biosynthesis protein [Algibacter sp. L1A34]